MCWLNPVIVEIMKSICQTQHCPRSLDDRCLSFGRRKRGRHGAPPGSPVNLIWSRHLNKYEETKKHGRYGRVISKFNLNQLVQSESVHRLLINPWLITCLTPAKWEVQVCHGTLVWHDDMNCTVHSIVSCQTWWDMIEISFGQINIMYSYHQLKNDEIYVQHRWSQESFAFMKLGTFGQALNITNGISSSFCAASCTCPWICCSRLTRILPNLCILFLRGLFANQYC